VTGILSSEPAGKALEECRKGQAIVTLDAGQEDREIRARFGIVALRRARLLRICVEACEQGIHLSHEDIAFVVQISEALSQQYLDLYRQYNTAEYRQRLDEIIGKARGGLSFSN
jgi:hypothetical protein